MGFYEVKESNAMQLLPSGDVSSQEVISKRIVVGNRAVLLAKPVNMHTHRWVVYVRPFDVEDLGCFIRKVQFKIFPTYENPCRVIDNPPFEIVETGFGSFDVEITLTFVDPSLSEVTLIHTLALVHPVVGTEGGRPLVVSETCEELRFPVSSPVIRAALAKSHVLPHDPSTWTTDWNQKISDFEVNMKNCSEVLLEDIQRLEMAVFDLLQYNRALRATVSAVYQDNEKKQPRTIDLPASVSVDATYAFPVANQFSRKKLHKRKVPRFTKKRRQSSGSGRFRQLEADADAALAGDGPGSQMEPPTY